MNVHAAHSSELLVVRRWAVQVALGGNGLGLMVASDSTAIDKELAMHAQRRSGVMRRSVRGALREWFCGFSVP